MQLTLPIEAGLKLYRSQRIIFVLPRFVVKEDEVISNPKSSGIALRERQGAGGSYAGVYCEQVSRL